MSSRFASAFRVFSRICETTCGSVGRSVTLRPKTFRKVLSALSTFSTSLATDSDSGFAEEIEASSRVRAYALPSLILPIQGIVNLSPESSTGWGMAILFSAFVVISLGVGVSLNREKILAWLEEDANPADAAGEAFALSSPNAWPGRTALALALIAAVGYVVAPVL